MPKPVKTRTKNKISNVVKAINEDFGAGTLKQSKDKGVSIPIKGFYSTGFETIDAAWGRGGAPWGRIVVLHGREGAGKTTVGLTLMGFAQRAGALGLFVDAEYKLDLPWAKICTVDVDDLILSQPDYLEKALELIAATMRKAASIGVRSFVVLDSMNACDTKEEFENTLEEDSYYGPKARVYSKALPKIAKAVKATESILVLVSQIRGGPQGNHIACGNAPKFYASTIASFKLPREGHRVTRGSRVVGVELEVEFIKNQVSPPYQKAKFRINGPNGPDFDWALLQQAAIQGLVVQGGAGWMEWKRSNGDEVKFQGVEGWRKLKNHDAFTDELRKEVRAYCEVA